MKVFAIDPGPNQSAFLLWDGAYCGGAVMGNAELLNDFRMAHYRGAQICAIEMVESFGMAVGREVFETVRWIGRFEEAAKIPVRLIYRKNVKMHLCQSMRAKDANIRAALIDKHGPPGTKKNQGKTYGISGHLWAALAIADYAVDHPSEAGRLFEAEREQKTQ